MWKDPVVIVQLIAIILFLAAVGFHLYTYFKDKQMFGSEDPASKLMAKDIVLRSRLSEEQINYFVTKHLYNLI